MFYAADGEAEAPAWEGGALQASAASGHPVAPEIPGPGAVLSWVRVHRGTQLRRGLSWDLEPSLGLKPLHSRGGQGKGPAGSLAPPLDRGWVADGAQDLYVNLVVLEPTLPPLPTEPFPQLGPPFSLVGRQGEGGYGGTRLRGQPLAAS